MVADSAWATGSALPARESGDEGLEKVMLGSIKASAWGCIMLERGPAAVAVTDEVAEAVVV